MKAYEAILIADPTLNEDGIAQLKTQFEEIVSKNGGRVQETSVLGRRKLSFKIGKHSEGNYLQIKLQLPSSGVDAVRRTANMIEPVVRLMVVISNPNANSQAKPQSSEGELNHNG